MKTAETSSAVAEEYDEEPSVPTLNKYKFSGKGNKYGRLIYARRTDTHRSAADKERCSRSYMLRESMATTLLFRLKAPQDMPPYHAYIPSELATAPLLLLSDPKMKIFLPA